MCCHSVCFCIELCVVSALNSWANQSEACISAAKSESLPFFWKPFGNYFQIIFTENKIRWKINENNFSIKKIKNLSVLFCALTCKQVCKRKTIIIGSTSCWCVLCIVLLSECATCFCVGFRNFAEREETRVFLWCMCCQLAYFGASGLRVKNWLSCLLGVLCRLPRSPPCPNVPSWSSGLRI